MLSKKKFEIYCAGKFITTPEILTVANPYDASEVAHTFLAGESELNLAIHAADEVAEEMANMPSYVRYNILKQISEEILALRQMFAELITLESGNPSGMRWLKLTGPSRLSRLLPKKASVCLQNISASTGHPLASEKKAM